MGTDKALVELSGRTMLEWVAAAAGGVGEVLVVGRTAEPGGAEAIPDIEEGPPGPLRGLCTAFRHAPGRRVLLLSVDQPWVRPETLAHLLARSSGWTTLPYDGGSRQVTCAVYPPDLAERAALTLVDSGSVQALLDSVEVDAVLEDQWRVWGEDGRSWYSANRPEDLDKGLGRFGPPG